MSHAMLILNPLFTNYESYHSCILICLILSTQYLNPTSITIQGQGKLSNITLSRPTPRSGWRVSLRRETLAQASLLRLGEGSKKGNSSSSEISLGRDARSLRSNVGRLSDRSRETSWASLYWSRLGKTSSLGRENQSSPLFSRAFTLNISPMAQNHHTPVHITYQTYPNGKTEAQSILLKRKGRTLASRTWKTS